MIHLVIAVAVAFSAASTLQNVVRAVKHEEHALAWFGALLYTAAIVSATLNAAYFIWEKQ